MADQRAGWVRNVDQPRDTPLRAGIGLVQLHQPRDKGGAGQAVEFMPGGRQRGVGFGFPERRFDGRIDGAADASEASFVFLQGQSPVAAIVRDQTFQREGKKREGVGLVEIGDQAVCQGRVDGDRRISEPGRAFDHFAESGGRQGGQVEQAQLRGEAAVGLKAAECVRADGGGDDQVGL